MRINILSTVFFQLFFFTSISWALSCKNNHTVGVGESCKSMISDAQITAQDFFKWNPSLKDGNCHHLHAGQIVCLGQESPVTTPNLTNTDSNNTTTNTTNTNDTLPSQPTKTKKKPHKARPPPTPTYLPGLTVAVNDEAQFCLLLPRTPGNQDNHNGTVDTDAIANSEKNAIVFCTDEELTPDAKLMPEGFIASAHYQFNTTADFVQVTGKINRDKYSLSEDDGGGQYDNHGAGSPPLSMCLGYRYYVSLIEPDIQGFCIRCCQSYEDCNASRSAYGCKRVIPTLDYSV